MRNKLALMVFSAGFLLTTPLFADSTSSFSFTNSLGNIGSSDTFSSGSYSVVATGYSAPGDTTNLYAKNEGASEYGIGIASGADHEITGTSFIQLNLTSILASNPASVSVGVGSIQNPDTYQIWGSNTAGTAGTLLASNQTAASFNLSTYSQYDYISVLSPTGTVLIDGLMVTPAAGGSTASTPESSSASLVLVGLIALMGAGFAGKKIKFV
jgi:hypothetical protein